MWVSSTSQFLPYALSDFPVVSDPKTKLRKVHVLLGTYLTNRLFGNAHGFLRYATTPFFLWPSTQLKSTVLRSPVYSPVSCTRLSHCQATFRSANCLGATADALRPIQSLDWPAPSVFGR